MNKSKKFNPARRQSVSAIVLQHANPIFLFKRFCQYCAGSFFFWSLVALLTLTEPVLCARQPVGIVFTLQVLVLICSTALYVIQLVGVATREWDKIVLIEAMTSLNSISIPRQVMDISLLKLFIFFTAEGEYMMEFACLLGGWLTIFIWPGIAVLRCFRVFRLLWFYEVEIFKSTTEYYMSPIVGKVFVNRGFKVLKFAIKSLTALGNELFRLTNETRGALLLMIIFFYSAYVIGVALWIETDGDSNLCTSVGSCTYTLMRLTFFDGDGFDFAYFLTADHRIMFCCVMAYMCLTSFGILNGLVGIFGTAIAQASDIAFNDQETQKSPRDYSDDEESDSDGYDDETVYKHEYSDSPHGGAALELTGIVKDEAGGSHVLSSTTGEESSLTGKEQKVGEALDGDNPQHPQFARIKKLIRTGTNKSRFSSGANSPRPLQAGSGHGSDDGAANDVADDQSQNSHISRAEQNMLKLRVAAALGGKSKFAQKQLLRSHTVAPKSTPQKPPSHLDDLVAVQMVMRAHSRRWKSGKFHQAGLDEEDDNDDGVDSVLTADAAAAVGDRHIDQHKVLPLSSHHSTPDRPTAGAAAGDRAEHINHHHHHEAKPAVRKPVSLFNAKGKSMKNVMGNTTATGTGAGGASSGSGNGAVTQKDVNLLLSNIHALSRKVETQNDMIVALYANIQFLNGQLQHVHPELKASAEEITAGISYPEMKPTRRFSQHATAHLPLNNASTTNNPVKPFFSRMGTASQGIASASSGPSSPAGTSPRRSSFAGKSHAGAGGNQFHTTPPQQQQQQQQPKESEKGPGSRRGSGTKNILGEASGAIVHTIESVEGVINNTMEHAIDSLESALHLPTHRGHSNKSTKATGVAPSPTTDATADAPTAAHPPSTSAPAAAMNAKIAVTGGGDAGAGSAGNGSSKKNAVEDAADTPAIHHTTSTSHRPDVESSTAPSSLKQQPSPDLRNRPDTAGDGVVGAYHNNSNLANSNLATASHETDAEGVAGAGGSQELSVGCSEIDL